MLPYDIQYNNMISRVLLLVPQLFLPPAWKKHYDILQLVARSYYAVQVLFYLYRTFYHCSILLVVYQRTRFLAIPWSHYIHGNRPVRVVASSVIITSQSNTTNQPARQSISRLAYLFFFHHHQGYQQTTPSGNLYDR